MGILSTGSGKRLLIATSVAALLAIPTIAAPQDITTLLAIFLRNLHAGRIVVPVSTLFANLPASANGTIAYCSDCTEATTPCTGSGSGAFALRQGGQWVCPDGGSGGTGVDDAEYWVGAAHADLTAEKNLGALSTALVINTAGVPSAYAGVDCTNQFVRDLSAVGAGTCNAVSLVNDITGTLAIGSGGTGQTTKTAAFNALADGSADGDLMVYNGTNWVRLARGATGQFLRTNASVSPALDWTTGPNVAGQDTDETTTSATGSNFLDMLAVPAADTWVQVNCRIWYQSAATTTGVGVGLFANNVGLTAAPQFFQAEVSVSGQNAGGGTDVPLVYYLTAASTYTTNTTGVQATTSWYLIKIDAIILTHATDAAFAIWPLLRTEVAGSGITAKEGSQCTTLVIRADG